jgi:hypothetical protein
MLGGQRFGNHSPLLGKDIHGVQNHDDSYIERPRQLIGGETLTWATAQVQENPFVQAALIGSRSHSMLLIQRI